VSAFESEFWGACLNTYDEESKHFVYANYMWVPVLHHSFHTNGCAILDIGSGPTSMLLKARDLGTGIVLDPLLTQFPEWVRERYKCAGLGQMPIRGEDLGTNLAVDEVWIYNVLQHVDDPEKVIANARRVSKRIRIFEWIDIPPYEGHPHMLTRQLLGKWLGRYGSIASVDEGGAVGLAFAGVFE
jgi:SAM-dependent methyltransferase